MTSDPTQIATIYIHFDRSLAHALWIALCFRLRRVLTITVHTSIALRSCVCFPSSVLTAGCLTIRTFLHVPILAHPFGHSLQVVLYFSNTFSSLPSSQ